MRLGDRIYVAGHRGLVGSAIVRRLEASGYGGLIVRTREELDLRRQDTVDRFFAETRPSCVFLAAARVGGILANDTYAAEFFRDNLLIEANVIHAAYANGVEKLLFLGSSCVYPRQAPQPLREEYLLTGAFEPTNQAYALAKIIGIEMLDAYRRQYGMHGLSVMPTNLYGPNDDFDSPNSHVLPALIRRFHDGKVERAPEVVVWGTGAARREFLHVDDLAAACVLLMENYDGAQLLNIGVGEDMTIREVAEMVRDVVGFEGTIRFDGTKPEGTPRKLLDVSRIHALGWRARIPLRQGLQATYAWFLERLRASAAGAPSA
ncbi:MAG TPA: GDP-L-fucose synthase [Polyangiaceae bacterium]|jgi:GDP-L-fucose synthase